MASNKTKFFRVAVEGATVDGREIKREWLTQMARHYDPTLYNARLNVEHIKGVAPMSSHAPFGAYGDVIALKAAEIEDGPLKGKLALYAQIDPTDELVTLSRKRQKLYTSIEVNPDFADLGEAYLVGLAATDDPASLGTEALQFAARRSNNLFSAACETSIEFEGEPESTSLLSIVKAMFARNRSSDDQRDTDVRRAVEEIAGFASQQGREVTALRSELSAAQQTAADAKQRADEAFAAIDALTAKLSAAENGAPHRPPSTGSSGELVTDC
ncbi:capsid scaffolding protein [Burkholderia sp. Nafp2/4-1b]|uniref:GPO family capsid scaffolding protein n=1 Tax=Burkholderia sp. Nafp2/4-1b TaxID=2116686 RepID=UPI000EF8576B|nr:GPO family capsid scaffolding protein [Burkholderia sp. Nafp2/4-1b]RKU01834.1 capsid scaffolding protein [Burkholderia sp. Nafp2/4-1b]